MILATPETRATTVKTEITELRLKMWRTQANSVHKDLCVHIHSEVTARYPIQEWWFWIRTCVISISQYSYTPECTASYKSLLSYSIYTKKVPPLKACLGPRAPEARHVNARFFLAQLKLPHFASGVFLKRASDATCLAGLFPRLAFKRRGHGPK